MTVKLLAALVATALLGAPVGYVFYQANLSPDSWTYEGGNPLHWKDNGPRGVPGPVVGTGLPVIAIGFGAYWLARRYRRKQEAA